MGYKNYRERFLLSPELVRVIQRGILEIHGTRRKVSIRKDFPYVEEPIRGLCGTIADNYRYGGHKATFALTQNGKLRKRVLRAFVFRICCGRRLHRQFSIEMNRLLMKLAKEGSLCHRIFRLEYVHGEIIVRAHQKEMPVTEKSTWVKATVSGRSVQL